MDVHMIAKIKKRLGTAQNILIASHIRPDGDAIGSLIGLGLALKNAGKTVQMILDTIVESLSRGETVELRNFGIFKVKSRKARLGRNPKTGHSVDIPAKKVVAFKAGLELREKVK